VGKSGFSQEHFLKNGGFRLFPIFPLPSIRGINMENEQSQNKNWRIEEVDFLPQRRVGTLYRDIVMDFLNSDMGIGKITIENKKPSSVYMGLKDAIRRMGLSRKLVVRKVNFEDGREEVYLINTEKVGYIPRR
jgi:ribosomal protein L19